MTLTAVAVAEQYTNPIRVRIDVDSTVLTQRAVTINRVHPDGSRWPVILEPNAKLIGGSWAGFDYLAPAIQRVTYEVTAGSETATSGAVTQITSQVRLQHPSDPTLAVVALFVPEGGLGDPGNEAKTGIFDIVGSDYAVSVTDETIRRTSSLRLALTPAQCVHGGPVDQLLRNGGPLLLNAPVRAGWDVSWLWVQRSGAVSKRNPGKTAAGGTAGYPHRILEMSYVVVDQPKVSQQSLWDYPAVEAAFDDYDDLMNSCADYEALATGAITG